MLIPPSGANHASARLGMKGHIRYLIFPQAPISIPHLWLGYHYNAVKYLTAFGIITGATASFGQLASSRWRSLQLDYPNFAPLGYDTSFLGIMGLASLGAIGLILRRNSY